MTIVNAPGGNLKPGFLATFQNAVNSYLGSNRLPDATATVSKAPYGLPVMNAAGQTIYVQFLGDTPPPVVTPPPPPPPVQSQQPPPPPPHHYFPPPPPPPAPVPSGGWLPEPTVQAVVNLQNAAFASGAATAASSFHTI